MDNEIVEVKAGTGRRTYSARLLCRDAAAIVRKVKAALNLETAIRRVSLRIEYDASPGLSRAMVNLVA